MCVFCLFACTWLGLSTLSVQAQEGAIEQIRLRGDRDLRRIAVIGLLTGKTDYTQTAIQLNGRVYTIHKTENAKPFTVLTFSRNWVEIKLKNDAPPPQISHFAFRYFDSERSLYQALLLNQVDFAVLSDEAMALEVNRNNPNMIPAAIEKKRHTVEMIIYNLQHPILKNIEVRKAIAYAIRRKQLVEQVISGVPRQKGEVAKGSFYEPDHEFYPDGNIDEYDYNLRKARDLLEMSGWRDRNNDGVRERAGIKLSITLAYRGGIELEEKIARDILLACNRVGIEINGVGLSNQALNKMLRERSYEAVLWEHTFEENIESIYDFFTNDSTSFIGFRQPFYNNLYRLAQRSTERKRLVALAQGMQAAINRECVVACLFFKWYDYAIINSTKIENVRDLSTGQINSIDQWRFAQIRE